MCVCVCVCVCVSYSSLTYVCLLGYIYLLQYKHYYSATSVCFLSLLLATEFDFSCFGFDIGV
jgi:hypothetical protein